MNGLTVDRINNKAKENPQEFIFESEKNFEKMIEDITEKIKNENIRFVFLSGPSSSGKTTFSSKLVKKLAGTEHFDISLDDYYKRKDEMPLWKDSTLNFETINSLRLDVMKRDFKLLMEGKEVYLPLVDFKLDKLIEHNKKVKLKENTVVLIEGLHAVNKKITGIFEGEKTLKIFICPFPVIINKKGKAFSYADLRFIRRAVRDENYRNSDILNSFRLWDYVRKGEKQFMTTYKKNADVIGNTYLEYETCVLKKPALKMLLAVPEDNKYIRRAKRLINMLNEFEDIDVGLVDKDSLLNEFIKR